MASQNAAARTISDRASLTTVPGAQVPTGAVTFTVFGPNNATCTGAPAFTSTNPVGGGIATSNSFPVTRPGTYRFVASYGGDANYVGAASPCNAPNQSVVVVPAR